MNKIINEAHNEEFFKKVQPHLPVRELGNCSVYKPSTAQSHQSTSRRILKRGRLLKRPAVEDPGKTKSWSWITPLVYFQLENINELNE